MTDYKVKNVLFTGKKYSNGESPILVRVTALRKSIYLSTGQTCFKENWDKNTSCLYSSKPRIKEKQQIELNSDSLKALKKEYSKVRVNLKNKKINAEIEEKLQKVKDEIKKHNHLKDINLVFKLLKQGEKTGLEYSKDSYLSFAQKVVKDELVSGNIKSYKRFNSIVNRLEQFLNRHNPIDANASIENDSIIKKEDLTFSNLTPDLLRQFEGWMKKEGNKTNTIHKNFKGIRTILYRAIKEGLFKQEKNPFFTFKLKQDSDTKKAKLSIEEIKRFKGVKLESSTLMFHSKNCFLFSFFNAGIRIGDLLQIKWENIEEGRLNYKMGKNKKNVSVMLNKEALKILDLYSSKSNQPQQYIFPFLNEENEALNPLQFDNLLSTKTAEINKCLKEIAKLADIKKSISTHIARHTFSDLARSKNVSIYDISKALRHSSIKQTESYLKSLDDESLDKAFETTFDGI
ncbi:MAG: site-specific integrase [Sphingobacteriaceae bacterium]|nr:site-specific integrase [Sphingobacteriaceae bacterium]